MKKRIFTLMMAFLAVASGAVWGQTYGTPDNPVKIDISFMYGAGSEAPTGDGFTAVKGVGATLHSNTLNITSGGYYKLTGTESNIQIKVSATDPVHITVASGIHIDASLDNTVTDPSKYGSDIFEDRCALQINSDAHVTLDWEGNAGSHVEFSSGGHRAGINVKPGATLVLQGTHDAELWGTCWNNQDGVYTSGAGIGGDSVEPDFGTIIIESGTVEGHCFAQVNGWQAYGAGIGGGFKQGNPNAVSNGEGSTEGTIIIKGGTVTGTANYPGNGGNINPTTGRSAAIGGGYKGTCTNIAILGGTVNATTGNLADAIGVGEDYDNGITEGIVIGQWDKKTTAPNIADGITINDVNIVKGEEGSLNGNVTMPKGTQMYVPNETVAGDAQSDVFNAYNYTLSNGKLGDETGHNPEVPTEVSDQSHYYYGPGMSFTVPDMSCSDNHLFLGWYKDDNNLVASNNGNSTFEVPNTALTSPVNYVYAPVWVDNEYSITVKTGTEWKKDGENTPKIAYSPDGSSSDVLSKLNFEFTTNPLPAELTGLQFDGNQLIGTPTLQGSDTYKKYDLTATVSLNNGTKQDITISVTIVDEIMINSIAVASTNHIYNGQLHNGTQGGGVNSDYVLDVKMTHDIDGTQLTEPQQLREGIHYRIYKYSFEGGAEQTAEGSTQSLPIKNAGLYSNITIQAIDAVLTDDQYLPIIDGTKNLGNATIVVAQRPMNISISFNKQSIEEDEELTWDDDVTVDIEEMTSGRGLVTNEDIKVTGTINYVLNEEGTAATVSITNIKIEDGKTFKQSNYKIYVNDNDEEFREDAGLEIVDDNVPVTSPSTGGSFNDHRYQLFLANKDYLKTDEKTVEYYEDLKLELFSRHNKKYTDAGGSFTIWYEKDGEANVGGYRLFWSKSGEHGDYQEVKFDPVSEYFRIDNVHSDVYVKIYDADGFPVANEAITAQDFRAYAQPNKIIVITPEPTDVQIISMAGAVVAADKVTGQREFANLAEGVYIVRMGETIVKLQVRN